MSALAAALALAARGFHVFPCLPSKAPACPHGHLDATANPAALRELWRRYGGDLVGTPTGTVNAFDVLDIDPRHGGDTWHTANLARLPATRTHETRSGGLHLCFSHRDGVKNSASKIAPGIDVRGGGGFVIWWPAAGCRVLQAGPPVDWPDWLVTLLCPPPPAPPSPPVPMHTNVNANTLALRLIQRALFKVRTASPGERHTKLRAAACTIGGLLDEVGFSEAAAERELLAAVLAAGGNDVREPNAKRTIEWGLKRGRASPLRLTEGGQHG